MAELLFLLENIHFWNCAKVENENGRSGSMGRMINDYNTKFYINLKDIDSGGGGEGRFKENGFSFFCIFKFFPFSLNEINYMWNKSSNDRRIFRCFAKIFLSLQTHFDFFFLSTTSFVRPKSFNNPSRRRK